MEIAVLENLEAELGNKEMLAVQGVARGILELDGISHRERIYSVPMEDTYEMPEIVLGHS